MTVTRAGKIIVVRGWKAYDLIQGAGLRPTFSGSAGGWMLDAQHLPDLLAFLDSRNIGVLVLEPEDGPGAA